MFVCRKEQLEHALLLYLAGQYDDALLEFELYKQDCEAIQREQVDVMIARLTFCLSELNASTS